MPEIRILNFLTAQIRMAVLSTPPHSVPSSDQFKTDKLWRKHPPAVFSQFQDFFERTGIGSKSRRNFEHAWASVSTRRIIVFPKLFKITKISLKICQIKILTHSCLWNSIPFHGKLTSTFYFLQRFYEFWVERGGYEKMQSYDAKLVRMKARQRSGIASFEFVSLKHRDSLELTKVVSEKPKTS